VTDVNEFPIEYFHEEEDGNDYAPAFMRAQLSIAQYGTMTVTLAPRIYRCAGDVDIIRPFFRIRGIRPGNSSVNSVMNDAQIPSLWFQNGGQLETHYPGSYLGGTYGSLVVGADAAARSDDFRVEGFAILGPGVTAGANSASPFAGAIDEYGLRARFTFAARDMLIRGFRGGGIYANASAGGTDNLGNINASHMQGIQIRDCGGPGLYIGGGDGNVVTVMPPFRVAECGSDLKSRGGYFTRILVGQHMHEVTITSAVNSTLYRLVVSGNNADYTSDSSATTTEIAAGLAAAVNALALANIFAQQIDANRVLVYSTNSTSFTCTESSANMTLATTATTASPTAAHCVGGPASHELRLNDTCSCWMPGLSWGFVRGDIIDAPVGYGYIEIDLRLERVGDDGDSISQVSGSTWQMITSSRSWTGPGHTGRTLDIFGATALANIGSFPITAICAGVYGASSIRLRVSYAQPNALYWVRIRGTASGSFTHVEVTSSGSPTLGSIRDQLVTAIAAAGITGVSVAATSSADLTITATGVIVAPGPRVDNVDGAARTVIEYTNAAGVADASFDGYWRIDARSGTRGTYEPGGSGALVFGRGVQVQVSPQIEDKLSQVLIVGPTDGDGFMCKAGRPIFEHCYTEGELPAITVAEGASFREGSMYPQLAVKAEMVDQTRHALVPAVVGSYADPGNAGAVVGSLGDPDYANVAMGFEIVGSERGDRWRLHYQQTAQGVGSWELALNALSEMVALRLGNLNDRRIGVGSFATGQPGFFTNYANGSLRSPRSAVPNGSNGVTFTTDSDNTGAIGYIEWRQNGNYRCKVDVLGVYLISSVTSATPGVVNIGTHNIPAGAIGRCIIRNVQGTSGANGDRQWTRSGTATISLQDTAAANVATSGTNVADSGVAILCRLIAFGRITGTSLSLSTGNWMVGDRFINTVPVSGDSYEWICTTTGVGTNAVWESMGARP